MPDKFTIDSGNLRQRIVLQAATVGSADSRGRPQITWPDSITVASWAGGTATITIHGTLPDEFVAGVSVGIIGMFPAAWNGTYTVAAVQTTSRFTVAIASDPGTATKFGNIQCDPAPGTSIWCEVEGLSGRKLEIARQYVSTASHLVTVRGNRTIDENLNRFVYKFGRILNIGWSADIKEYHVRLELTCTELKPEP